MEHKDFLTFGGHNLFRLRSDFVKCKKTLIAGIADGVFINPEDGYDLDDLDGLMSLPEFKALATVGMLRNAKAVENLLWLQHLSIEAAKDLNPSLNKLTQLKSLRVTLGKGLQLPSVVMLELETLWVWSFTDSNLECLKNFPNLKDLTIIQAPKLSNITQIKNCPKLTKIDIGYCPQLTSIDGLHFCKSLTELQLTNLGKLVAITPIFQLTSLQRLIIKKLPPVPNLGGINQLNRLDHLALVDTEVLDGDLSSLLKMQRLTHCHIRPNKKQYQPAASTVCDTIKKRASEISG